jgi:predicted glycosyltransferase
MKIWYDACTGKHVRYGSAIVKRLNEKGYETIFTLREHPDTIPLAKYLGVKFEVVGKYNPKSYFTRLYESLKRESEFCRMFRETAPHIAISHQSVEQCRVAFGLRIPIISTHDTPHAEAVNRLTLPLIDTLVVSEAIPDSHLRGYPIKRIIKFKGVDEVAWIKDFKPKQKFDYEHPFVVIRQLETKATYAEGREDITLKVAKKLSKYYKVIFLSRYKRTPIKGLIVPEEFVDSASLAAEADVVISVGGTISREAALQGTPSIVIPALGRAAVNEYLSKKGFPIFTVEPTNLVESVRSMIGKKFDTKALLSELENPVDLIEKLVKLFEENHVKE